MENRMSKVYYKLSPFAEQPRPMWIEMICEAQKLVFELIFRFFSTDVSARGPSVCLCVCHTRTSC